MRKGSPNSGSTEEPAMAVCGEWIGQLHSMARRTLEDITTTDVRVVAGVYWIPLVDAWTLGTVTVNLYSILKFVNCLKIGTDSLLAGCPRLAFEALGLNINLNNGFNCVCACFRMNCMKGPFQNGEECGEKRRQAKDRVQNGGLPGVGLPASVRYA